MALWPWTNINIWSCSGQDCDHGSVIRSRLDNAEWIYKVLPVSGWISRWRYDTEEILTHRAVQAWSLIRRQKFGGDRTLHTGVMTTSCPIGEGWSFARPQCLHGLRKCHNSDHGPMTWLSSFELYIVKKPGTVHQSIKHVTSCSQQVALWF